MRLVTQAEFIALPDGTLYARLNQPWVFDDLCIKGEKVSSNDFYERQLAWVDADDTGMALDRLDEMLRDSSVSYPVEQAYGREGLYKTDARYLVYEVDDVKLLLSELRQAYELGDES